MTSIDPFSSNKEIGFLSRSEDDWPEMGVEWARSAGLLGKSLEPGDSWDCLLSNLRGIGFCDLTLGRIVEGHLNGLQLVRSFGRPDQIREMEHRASLGGLSAIWDSEIPGQGVTISLEGNDRICLKGKKAFASAAGRASMPVLTATWDSDAENAGEKQMVILDGEAEGVFYGGSEIELIGVKGTATTSVSLDQVILPVSCLVGEPGDYLREPWLTVGAVRFQALWVGAMERLLELVRDHYQKTIAPARNASERRAARLGACVWQARSLLDSMCDSLTKIMPEAFLYPESRSSLAGAPINARRRWAIDSLCSQVLCGRHAIEDLAQEALHLAEQEVGLKGLVEGHPLGRLIRDLTVYLRQPATDTSLDRSGRYILAGSPGHYAGELWEEDREFASISRYLRGSPLDEGFQKNVSEDFVHQLGRTLVLAPHPDDECLGAGGILALLAERGLPAKVIFLTDGEDSQPESAVRSRADLAKQRRAEAVAACNLLGVEDVNFCHFSDGKVPFEGEEGFEEAVVELVRSLQEFEPHTVVTTWRRDRHGDHRAAYQMARELIVRMPGRPRLVEFPVWVWEARSPTEVPRGDEVHAVAVQLGDRVFQKKCRALECHASQIRSEESKDQPGFFLEPRHLDRFSKNREILLLPKKGSVGSVTSDYFEKKYAKSPDPWSYEKSSYEREKYKHLLSLLPEAEVESVLELGCSIGVLTQLLADRCRHLTAMDCSPTALSRAKQRMSGAGVDNVEFVCGQLPTGFPDGAFDTIILSEVGYYLEEEELEILIDRVLAALSPGGSILLMHWTVYVEDYPITGDAVHECFAAAAKSKGFDHPAGGRREFYRWDVWKHPKENQ